jgi:uncharacterized protein YqeY
LAYPRIDAGGLPGQDGRFTEKWRKPVLDRIQAELKKAMLAKDAPRTQVLRSLLSAYRNEAVAKGLGPQGSLTEAEALAVAKRLVKSREDSVEQYLKGGAEDRAALEQTEIGVLKEFLPAMLEGGALEAAVKEAIAATGAASRKEIGLVMKHLQAQHGGAFDGKAANQIIQKLLS